MNGLFFFVGIIFFILALGVPMSPAFLCGIIGAAFVCASFFAP